MVALTGAARAADPAQERLSKQHFDRGARAYEEGRYDEAFKEFEAGHDLVPRPGFILNMAHAQRRMGDLRKARSLYQRYLLAEPDSDQADSVRATISDLDEAIRIEDLTLLRTEPPPTPPPQAPPPVATPIVVSAPSPAPVAARPRPWYTHWWVWTAGGVVLVGAATALALALSGPDYTQRGSLGEFGGR